MEQFGVDRPEDIAWNTRGMMMQPLKTFVEPLTLNSEPLPFPVTYVRFTERQWACLTSFQPAQGARLGLSGNAVDHTRLRPLYPSNVQNC
jgi:hypothetical protein